MLTVPAFTSLSMSTSNNITGGLATFIINAQASIALVQNDALILNFPNDIVLPSIVSCYPNSASLQQVSCSQPASGKIQASFTFNTNTVAAGTQITFNI
jgi:hypothetical protein